MIIYDIFIIFYHIYIYYKYFVCIHIHIPIGPIRHAITIYIVQNYCVHCIKYTVVNNLKQV